MLIENLRKLLLTCLVYIFKWLLLSIVRFYNLIDVFFCRRLTVICIELILLINGLSVFNRALQVLDIFVIFNL